MNDKEMQYRQLMLSQLIAGLYKALYGSVLRDYAASAIAVEIIYSNDPIIIAEAFMCHDEAITIGKMSKTLWTMIKNTDVTLLKDGYYSD